MVQRAQIERYVRWMQKVRRFQPLYGVAEDGGGDWLYPTCEIDAVLEHSPADWGGWASSDRE